MTVCQFNEGKWAANGAYCIPRDCANTQSCKVSYDNVRNCSKVVIGIDKNELFFHLGMPMQQKGNLYTFDGGAINGTIEVTLYDEKVVELKCDQVGSES